MPVEPTLSHGEPMSAWSTLYVATTGLSHLEGIPPLPCQDAAGAASSPRPMLAVADGAGSSPASDLGARSLVAAMLRLAETLEVQLAWLLDADAEPDPEAVRQFSELLVRHARGTLEDLATELHRPVRDLRCTLLLVVVGHSRLLWLKVGDGEIVLERATPVTVREGEEPGLAPHLSILGERGKGEFANQTVFVDERLALEQTQHGCVSAAALTGIALLSDGAAEKLVSLDGQQVSGQLSHWLDDLRQGRLRQRDLVRRFYSEEFCRGTSGDDRSIALLARKMEAL
ncbi:protein phosphatase 2C domain-containing protein [Billgrantia diversa]|uniref:PP2C family serine/threonine-protein phosphatase n=1 Tax=Halomonas sp. MCCC 1A13316 TaxID=2733487 RepID=UPI0018A45EB0|nr:PP2C family serine/threonine-protein phosphatase [Halomonas sp. MCCC 1A13316]QOR37402.1 protein phosphatase 2C domain-containing protein [Halomonas sp. MCCC 1A13316]